VNEFLKQRSGYLYHKLTAFQTLRWNLQLGSLIVLEIP
jgi:hypothetical protein